MRTETQYNVDAITKSLRLLGQRMDWETAGHRLEEFDAMIEAPDLWNDPARAQKLMRARQGLLDQMSTYRLIESGLREGERVVVEGLHLLAPGAPVKPVPAGTSAATSNAPAQPNGAKPGPPS